MKNNLISMFHSKINYLVIISLTIIILAVYWQVHNFDFVNYDDDVYVTKNPFVRYGLTKSNILWAFTTTYGNFWHPLTWLSHMADTTIFGMDPGKHHISSLLLHLANTILLFLILKQMTGALWQSAFVAALFGLHPLHVESVAWVSERKDVLSTLFFMLTISAYVSYTKSLPLPVKDNSLKLKYISVMFFYALGLMSKPMLVTLPFILLLLDYWPTERFQRESSRKLIIEKTPLFILTIISSITAFFAQKWGGAVASLDSYPLWVRITNGAVSYVAYIGKMFWPLDLAVFYPHPGESINFWQGAGAGGLLVLVSSVAVIMRKKHPYLLTGWLWYLGTLVPVIGLVQVGVHSMADRYTYIPLIGLFIMLTWGSHSLFSKYFTGIDKAGLQRFLEITIALVILATLSIISKQQVSLWQNSLTLWTHELTLFNDVSAGYNNRGNAYIESGNYTKAIGDLNTAVKLSPRAADVYNNRAVVFIETGQFRLAMSDLNKAIELNPLYSDALINRCGLYVSIKRYGDAIKDCSYAIKIDPNKAMSYNSRGIAYEMSGRYDKAIADYSKAIAHSPQTAILFKNRGIAYQKSGKAQMAKKDLKKAEELEKLH